MSLVDSDHIRPAKTRHGAHYHLIGGKPGMTLSRDSLSMPYRKNERICPNCFWTPWTEDTMKCKRCGSLIEQT
jgi:hypothetical protein